MATIRASRHAKNFRMDVGIALLGVLKALDNQSSCTMGWHKAFSIGIVGPAGALGLVVKTLKGNRAHQTHGV